MDVLLELIPAFVLLLIVIIVLIVIFVLFNHYTIQKLPDVTPKKYLRSLERDVLTERETVVCIGDSITHGRISQNYLSFLRRKLDDKYEFINAGLNSHLAWNVLERLDEIIECNPTIITILIGTNDVNAKLSIKNEKDYIKRMKLSRSPEHQWFCETLKEIIKRLKEETEAHIAILTLPMIGESLEGRFFALTDKYSKSIIEIAQEMKIESLPLHRTMIEYLEKCPGKPTYEYESERMYIVRSFVQHYFLRKSWDQIAANTGFKLHRDYLHMNSKGAIMIAELIENYIHSLN